MPKKSLGKSLLEMLHAINALLKTTQNEDRIKEIFAQRKRLNKQITELVDATLDRESQEYKNATAALEAAQTKIKDTIRGLESVAKAIAAAASALDEVAKLLAA